MIDSQDDFFGASYINQNPYGAEQQQQTENNLAAQQTQQTQQTQQQQLPASTAENYTFNAGAGTSNTAPSNTGFYYPQNQTTQQSAPTTQQSAPQYSYMEGVDPAKMNDANFSSPKYVASRILASGGTLQQAAAAIGATVLDGTRMKLSTGEEIDTRRDEEGANQLQWLVQGGGGTPPPTGGSTPPPNTGGYYNPYTFMNPQMGGYGGYQNFSNPYGGYTGGTGNTGISGGLNLSQYGFNPRMQSLAGGGGAQTMSLIDPNMYTGNGGNGSGAGTGGSTPPGGSQNQGSGGYNGPFTADMGPLRQQLQNYLMGRLGQDPTPQPFPWTLTTGDPWGMQQAYGRYMAGPDQVNQMIQPMLGTYGQAFNNAMSLTQNGGLPDMNPYLNAVQQHSQSMLNQNLAGIKEQYGALGLGAGSDISGALAQGTATGVAQMNQDMLNTVLQATIAGGQNRVGALNAMGNLTGQYGNLALGQGQLWNQSANGLLGVGGLEQQINEGNMMRGYNEFIRQTSPSPYLNAALSYATGFPPMSQSGGSGAMLGAAGIGAAGSILSQLPWLTMFSDRALKEDIRPIDVEDLLDGVRRIDVSKWRYTGFTGDHIGPMAQDFKKEFGVGDGHVIMTIDALGVLYGAVQALAQRVDELEGRNGR